VMGLGATVAVEQQPFDPEDGAYAGGHHSHGHDSDSHVHSHGDTHDHGHHHEH